MFRLSEAELRVLEELWKLIHTGCTTQVMPSEEASSQTSLPMQQQLDVPPDRRSDENSAPQIHQ